MNAAAAAAAPQMPDMALYLGEVSHQRRAVARYRFRQPLLMLFVNTDKLAALAAALGALAKTGLLNWRRQDYMPHPTLSLSAAVLQELHRQTGARAAGPVFALAQPRQFGCAYNPAAFYFICDGDSSRAAYILVEVRNTPWGERFCYAAAYPAADSSAAAAAAQMPKRRRVSPFNPLDLTYHWRYTQPGARFSMGMRCRDAAGAVHLDAALHLRRAPLTRRALGAAILRRPFSAAAAHFAIYRHAAALYLRRVPLRREQFGAAPLSPPPAS